jgi:hypothetical protein
MTMRRLPCLVMCACCAALVLRCSPPTNLVGGSEVVGFTGTLVKPDGTPAINALVYLDTMTSSSDSAKLLDSTETDAKGGFIVKRDNGRGTYSIYGNYKNRELVLLVRDLKDTNASKVYHEVNIGTRTMLPPGSISGKVIINKPVTAMQGIHCYIPGTSFGAFTDDTGGFVMIGIPQGVYRVYYDYPLYLTYKDSADTVISGKQTPVGTKILFYDPTGDPPVPVGISTVYDTIHGVVVVSWSAVPVSDLVGYVVYRNSAAIDTLGKSDTVYLDTVYRDFTDMTEHQYAYQVKALDKNNNLSPFSVSATAATVSPSLVRTVFGFAPLQTGDTVEAGDTVKIGVSFANNKNFNRTISWYGARPGVAPALRQDTVDALFGNDTLAQVFASSGRVVLYVEAVDDHANHWLDSIVLGVRPRHVDVVSCDSTTTGVTVQWNKSNQPEFAAYRLFRRFAGSDTLLYKTTARADTSHTVPLTRNGIFQYCVIVVDSLGQNSPMGKSIGARIKNTPPQFTNDTADVSKIGSVGKLYQVKLTIADVNKDSLTFKQLGSPGLTIADTTLTWTPAIADTGTKHIAVQASDGFGGYDTIQWNVKVLPVGVCAYGDSMPTARFSLGAAVVNGTLYAVGGAKYLNSNPTPLPFPIVEAYPLSGGGTWSKAASLISPRYDLGCAGSGGTLFSFGGTKNGASHFATIDSFSVAGGTWDTAAMLPVPLTGGCSGCAVCAIGTKVYCTGGITMVAGENVVSDAIYEFDITTGQCVLINNMSTKRTNHQAVAFGGKIYIIGGLGGSSSLAECAELGSMEVFDPQTGMIEADTLSPLLTPRYNFGATEANGKLYALGGYKSTSSDSALSSIEEYELSSNTWTVKGELPAPRSSCAAVSWQGRVYVVGGKVAGKATSSVVVYYP